ncbi:MAG: hypothetical protein SAL07_11265 [Oscillatoria sp. PMC 1051.18]|nr:hypothetical protein [Oscillatoria sp. PMC 1050.18]MEC5030485.1 hypothetical protein [Oscillatoria sp. PMC 1051.18]
MISIRDLANQAITSGYLSLSAEEKLRNLLCQHYDLEDLDAFMKLQVEAMEGRVRQESREKGKYAHRSFS